MEKRLADKNALNCTALSTLVHSGRAFVYDPALNCQLFKVFLTLTPSLHASAMSMVEAVNCGQERGWTLAGVVEWTPPWLQPSRSMSKTLFTDQCPWFTIAALKFLKDKDYLSMNHQRYKVCWNWLAQLFLLQSSQWYFLLHYFSDILF